MYMQNKLDDVKWGSTEVIKRARIMMLLLSPFFFVGFLTAKGNLVRSIMYPPPVDYRFERDSYKFVAVLGCIAIIGFIYSVFLKVCL